MKNIINRTLQNMNTNYLFTTLFFFLILTFSCSINKENQTQINDKSLFDNEKLNNLAEILTSKSEAVYLSFDTLNPDFGRLIIMDLISRNSAEIVDNKYYISNPIFFDRRGKILFESARIGNPNRLKLRSYHVRRQLYLFDSESLLIEQYFKYDGDLYDRNAISHFVGLCKDFSRNQIYFVNDNNNKMYKIKDNEPTPIELISFDENLIIRDLKISPNNKYIAIDYLHAEEDALGIYIYHISTNRIVNEIKGLEINMRLLGWTFDNNVFYYQEDGLLEFNSLSNIVKNIDIGLDYRKFFIDEIYAENRDSIIFLASILNRDKLETSTEIGRYNFKSKQIEWLTNDGYLKRDLTILQSLE